MRPSAWTRGGSAVGALWVLGSTLLTWSIGVTNVPRRVYTYTPGVIPHHSLWQASAGIAVFLLAGAAVSFVALWLPIRPTWSRLISNLGALAVLSLSLDSWSRPPGNYAAPGHGLGETQAIVGAIILLAASPHPPHPQRGTCQKKRPELRRSRFCELTNEGPPGSSLSHRRKARGREEPGGPEVAKTTPEPARSQPRGASSGTPR